MATFFSPASTKFLRDLKRNNDRTWFLDHKAIYERELKQPMLALIGELNDEIALFAPRHVRAPEKSLLRIYRDVRFSPDKRPYKTHVAVWWARDGFAKTSGGGFYFDLSGTGITIAAGVFMPDRDQLLAIRRSLLTSYAELDRLTSTKRLRGMLTIAEGSALTRPPKGFADALPDALPWIQCRQWGVHISLPVSHATSPQLKDEILQRFKLAAPIVDYLNRPFGTPPKKALF